MWDALWITNPALGLKYSVTRGYQHPPHNPITTPFLLLSKGSVTGAYWVDLQESTQHRAWQWGPRGGDSLSSSVLLPAMLLNARSSLSTRAGRCRYELREGQSGGAGRSFRVLPWLRPLSYQLDQTGQHLFCVCGTKLNILDVASGAMLQSLEQVRAGRVRVRD